MSACSEVLRLHRYQFAGLKLLRYGESGQASNEKKILIQEWVSEYFDLLGQFMPDSDRVLMPRQVCVCACARLRVTHAAEPVPTVQDDICAVVPW